MKKITDKQAIKAIKKLKKYCKKHSDDCEKYIFNYPVYEDDENFCGMNFMFSPETWGIKALKGLKK